jgi:hypothetical protein
MTATIKAGTKIRNVRNTLVEGTLACLVRARSDPSLLYILSAAHVIGLNGYAEPGDDIEAEDPPGTGTWVKIGEFERAYKWVDAEGTFQQCDAALARVVIPNPILQEIDGIGPIGGVTTRLYERMPLKFRGAGTGQPCQAELYSYDTGVPVIYEDIETGDQFEMEYANQILYVRPGGGVPVSPTRPADSGALVLSADNEAIGMHFSRTPDNFAVNAAVCSPMNTILSALDVELVPPDAVPNAVATNLATPPGAVTRPAPAPAPAPAPPPPPAAPDDVGEKGFAAFGVLIRSLLDPHRIYEGISWYLGPDGLVVDNKLEGTGGKMVTVPRVWTAFGAKIVQAAQHYDVPIELIIATICTESGGNPNAVRTEPGWTSDAATPHLVSVGLMQTLISTARGALHNAAVDRTALLDPANSIDAGTAYIAQQKFSTRFDPPLVACAYNAGGLYPNKGPANRWKLKQYPIGSGVHADRFVKWFNDSFAFLTPFVGQLPAQPHPISFVQLMRS